MAPSSCTSPCLPWPFSLLLAWPLACPFQLTPRYFPLAPVSASLLPSAAVLAILRLDPCLPGAASLPPHEAGLPSTQESPAQSRSSPFIKALDQTSSPPPLDFFSAAPLSSSLACPLPSPLPPSSPRQASSLRPRNVNLSRSFQRPLPSSPYFSFSGII